MGTYLNPGNSGFKRILKGNYVDKTGMIGLVNERIETSNNLICISRPRRFGKSYAAQMLCAYYDHTCNSHSLFDDKQVSKTEYYGDCINKFNVIYLDMTNLLGKVKPESLIAFIEELNLQDVAFYGFSDGGIIGLLAAMRCERITDLITSGANLTPDGVKPWLKYFIKAMYLVTKDPKMRLMLEEPHITAEDLSFIHARTLILAGSNDAVTESETIQIAEGIPGAVLRILDGETHGSYIVHSRKIGDLLLGWLSQRT